VLGQSGLHLVSIRTALTESHTIREFDGLGPLESVAILRLLVAILVDTLRWETTAEWGEAWALSQFDATRVDAYLGRHAHRFDLFDDADPFYQVATLEPINSTGIKSVALVMPCPRSPAGTTHPCSAA